MVYNIHLSKASLKPMLKLIKRLGSIDNHFSYISKFSLQSVMVWSVWMYVKHC